MPKVKDHRISNYRSVFQTMQHWKTCIYYPPDLKTCIFFGREHAIQASIF